VSLHPKPEEDNPSYSNGSQAQDFAALSRSADHLYLMTYEQHGGFSDPGSIASLTWMEQMLDFARDRIPQAKLFAGLPLYGYDWTDDGPTKGLTYDDVRALQTRYSITPQWDGKAGEWHFSYRDETGRQHEAWYQDEKTIAARRALMKKLLIPNAALWRIGGEDQAAWQHLP
jgi:spore germination protein YaaH